MKRGVQPEIIEFKSYKESVPVLLDRIQANLIFSSQKTILLKPNLVNSSQHPVTTSPEFCDVIIQYIRNCTDSKIIIAEGCGDADYETTELFQLLGYQALASKYDIELLDLNYAPVTVKSEPRNKIFPKMALPNIAFESYIVSLPVLKAHSLARITGTLKNMMGFAPPKYYSGGSFWKKAGFHARMQQSIIELNRLITPDLTIMDASIGLADYHLGGSRCSPPVNKIISGFNPWNVDRMAADLLKMDWHTIRHVSSV